MKSSKTSHRHADIFNVNICNTSNTIAGKLASSLFCSIMLWMISKYFLRRFWYSFYS